MKNGYFIGNIPNIFRQTHMVYSMAVNLKSSELGLLYRFRSICGSRNRQIHAIGGRTAWRTSGESAKKEKVFTSQRGMGYKDVYPRIHALSRPSENNVGQLWSSYQLHHSHLKPPAFPKNILQFVLCTKQPLLQWILHGTYMMSVHMVNMCTKCTLQPIPVGN